MQVKRFVVALTEHCKTKNEHYLSMMAAGKKKLVAYLKDTKIPPKRRLQTKRCTKSIIFIMTVHEVDTFTCF